MIKYVYAAKNVKSGNFNAPQLNDIPEDNAAENFEISFKETPRSQKELMKELDIYYLGTFDTKTGIYSTKDPVFIISGASVLGDADE